MPRTRPMNTEGFTLIELAIVLGVLAIIIAGIWLVVGVTYENVRQYQANREMQSMVQNIRQLETRITHFSGSAGTDLTLTLDQQNAFPTEMRMSTGTANGNLNHPWSNTGNSVAVVVVDASTFGIDFKNMPKKPCIQVATKLSGGEISGLTAVKINGTLNSPSALPLTLVTAAVQCNSLTSNTIEWQFNLRGN